MCVLILEDDPLLGEVLAAGLKRGFVPDWVQKGREAQMAMLVEPFVRLPAATRSPY